MAGLLGDGWDDPRSAAIMALSQGLLQGNFGAGIGGAQQAYQGAQDGLLKRQLLTEDISLKRLAEQRAQALFKMQQEAYGSVGQDGGGAPMQSAIPASPGGALGSGTFGIPMGGQSASPSPQSNIAAQLLQLERQSIAGVPGAKERFEILKYRNDPQKIDAGSYSRNPVTGQMTFNVDPKVGLGMDAQGGIIRAPGSQNIAAMAGELAGAQEAAKNANTLLPQGYVDSGTGRPMGGTIADYLRSRQPAPQPQAPQGLQNQGGGSLSPELQAFIQADAQKNGIQNPQVNFSAPGVRNPTFGLQQQLPPSLARVPSGQLQSPAEADAEKIGATAPANAAAAFLKGRSENMVKYEDNLNGRVAQGNELNMRLQEQLGALQKFKAGGGGETRAQLASMAQAIPGIPSFVVNGIAGGDLSAMQEFNKLAAQTAMEQLKSSMGGAGRISQYEFKVFQQNNPNLSTDPDAIKKIFDFNTKLFNRDMAEQQAFNQHIGSGGDPAAFPLAWQAQLQQRGDTNPNMRAQTTPLPPNPSASNLTKGQAYTLPNGKTGVWDGMGFKVQ